jgi:hypothetical protein
MCVECFQELLLLKAHAVCFNVLLLLLKYTEWRAGVFIWTSKMFSPAFRDKRVMGGP